MCCYFPPPGDLPDPGIELTSSVSLALWADSLPAEPSAEMSAEQNHFLLPCGLKSSSVVRGESHPLPELSVHNQDTAPETQDTDTFEANGCCWFNRE